MNILSFDIEEWALAKAGGYGTAKKYAEYDAFLNRILDVLDSRGFKATFFCTGIMAQDFPHIVKLIKSRGHEIGCHSYRHLWMNKLSETEAREDTHAAVSALEQCIGQKVICYRAPAFSIGESNKWLFEILAENGITVDSSIYPAKRDFGGFPTFDSQTPCIIKYHNLSIKEFPICMVDLFGKRMAYSGGGYFRFFPLSFVKRQMTRSNYTICYFHIKDLIPEMSGVPSKERFETYYKEKGSLKNRYLRYFKSNIGKKGAWKKLESLIADEVFDSINHSCSNTDWSKAETIEI